MQAKVNQVTIQLVQGDIFSQPAAGIVHQTDTNLVLHPTLLAKAGSEVQWECARIGYCEVGSAVITSAGNLPQVEKVLHAVGPRWGEGSERGKLLSVTFECLRLAEQYRLASIAFPAISTGILGYPLENCATTMLTQIIDFTFEDLNSLKIVILCLENPMAFDIFRKELEQQAEEVNPEI
jgi:O-acetyl-ADP-ribose deacetylase